MAVAFFFASSIKAASVPDQRTRHLPDASQKASPNLMPGTAPTIASWMSSTDLMKWVWPRTKLMSSGFSIFTVLSCMSNSYASFQQQEQHDHGRLRLDAVLEASGHGDPGACRRLVLVFAERHRRFA